MITTPKRQGKQVHFSGGPDFKVSVSKVGGYYIFSATELDKNAEVKFEIFDNHGHLIYNNKRTTNLDGNVSLNFSSKLDAGNYKLMITASKNRQVVVVKTHFDGG